MNAFALYAKVLKVLAGKVTNTWPFSTIENGKWRMTWIKQFIGAIIDRLLLTVYARDKQKDEAKSDYRLFN